MPALHFTFYLFCFAILYQLFVLLRYFVPLLRYQPKDANSSLPISVLICAHNEIENLKKHLLLILQQQHPNYEVIVVDDRSQDDSYEWLLTKTEEYKHLKIVRIEEVPHHFNNKKYALTIGIKAATNDLILLTDADCRVNSNQWVDRMSRSFYESTDFSLGVSLYQKRSGFLNNFIQYETYQTALLYLSRALAGKPYMGVGRNMAYRKSLFMSEKGFYGYQSITGGDDDLFVNKHAHNKNTTIVINADSITRSIPKSSWATYITQKKRHWAVGKYYKKRDKLFLGVLQFTTVLIYLCFVIGLFHLPQNFIIITAALLLLRLIGQYVVYAKLSIKFGDKFYSWLLPILEVYYLFFSIIIGFSAIRSKRIKWK